MRTVLGLIIVLGFDGLLLADTARADPPRLKVFILAGQSNMEGQGIIKADPKRNGGKGSLEYLTKDPGSAERFSFGHVIGDAFGEQVLLVKLAWGGKSLAKDFRPPSSGGDAGPYYTEIVKQTRAVLTNLKTLFPTYDGRGYEIAGFGWHQGWNDRVNQAFNDEYEKNLANFIRDIGKDLGVPKLPFVIAETGMSGAEEKHPRALSLMKAQAAVADYPEFQGNVAFVSTKSFWRPKEESPSNQAYHWNNNAQTYYLIGVGMAEAMKKLYGVAK
jgi:hypothetical protein